MLAYGCTEFPVAVKVIGCPATGEVLEAVKVIAAPGPSNVAVAEAVGAVPVALTTVAVNVSVIVAVLPPPLIGMLNELCPLPPAYVAVGKPLCVMVLLPDVSVTVMYSLLVKPVADTVNEPVPL